MALGGIASGAGADDFVAVCLCALLVAALCSIGFGGQGIGRSFVPVELCWQGRCVRVLALRDTGNTLHDPLTGERVLVAGADMGKALLGLTARQLSSPAETLAAGMAPGMRLIPYRTIGQRGAMMLALRFRDVRVGSWKGSALVAFAPECFGQDEGYQMLIGGKIG
jgi:stage II sporulation protein GA (sporulation sigma-E factor processing peptidase)